MRDKQEIRLDILSGIDEEIVNRNTYKRMKLMNRGKSAVIIKRRVIPIVAAAACFCIILSALFMILLGGKEVPVYTGMTASSTPPIASAKADGLFGFFSLEDPRYAMLHNSNKAPNLEGNNGNHHGQMKDAVDKELEKHTELQTERPTDSQGSLTVGENQELFYANANETVYITIHFNNPDAFEILSFVFNGQKYTSYMFEEGSTLENIVIKINVGDTAGLMEYTIDAIKYVDGTEIKDVKIGGDQTISIGVYSETLQPKPTVTEEAIDYNSISFKAEITDSFGLVEKSEGKLYAMLYDGEEIVGTQELTVGEVIDVRFEGLITGKQYHYAIVGVYDAYDKQGPASHILYSQECSTKTIFSFTEVTAETESISFSMLWDEAFENKTITSLALYKGEEKICDIDPNTPSIDGLLSNCEYTLVAEYINKGAAEKVEYNVKTAAKAIPQIKAESIEVPEVTSLKFKLEITDNDKVGRITAIELLCDGELCRTVDYIENIILFEGLEPLHMYTLRIVCTYDLNDGMGEHASSSTSDEVNLQSKGFAIQQSGNYGFITGLGSCTDTEIYINMSYPGNLFRENKSITKLHLGKNAKPGYAGKYYLAFSGCTSLTEVTLQEGYDVICDSMFYDCQNLVKVEIPQSVVKIDSSAFYDCQNLKYITLPENLVEIGESAFGSCVSLKIENIPQSLLKIGKDAFRRCDITGEITIPSAITEIPEGIFYGCIGLTKVNIHQGVTVIGDSAFTFCRGLTEITLPQNLTTLGNNAFQHCSGLTEIILPPKLMTIGDNVFSGCSGLKNVTIPENFKTIGNGMFHGCSELTEIVLPKNITAIGENTFYGCSGLTEIILPQSITAIGNRAFLGCSGLTEIILPQNLITIGDAAFSSCSGLIEITLPQSLTTVGYAAFDSCVNLERANIPFGMTEIPDGMFADCKLLSIVIPQDVTRIGTSAFRGNLLKEIVIPDKVTEIGPCAFADCKQMTKLTLPKVLPYIGEYAFSNISIEELILPDGVGAKHEFIWDYAFGNIGRLKKLVLPKTFVEISPTAFEGTRVDALYVSDLDTWLEGKKISITPPYELYINGEKITEITVPSDITKIREYAFLGCSNLKSITVTKGVKAIEVSAFEECKALESVTVLCNVSTIYENTFKDCSNLKDVYLPSSVTCIREGAFSGCGSSLTLHFDGTKEQWNNVMLVEGWKYNSALTVKCSDGDITYNYN